MRKTRLVLPIIARWTDRLAARDALERRDDAERREMLERFVLLIPPPRPHQVRFHGVLAPCASGQDRLVRQRPRRPASPDYRVGLVDGTRCFRISVVEFREATLGVQA